MDRADAAVHPRRRRGRAALWLGAAAVAAGALVSPRAEAVVVERVVAVIGEKAVLQTDLRKRARPFLLQLYTRVPEGPQRAAAESKVFTQLIERMVDEELEAAAAAKSNTTVTPKEIDRAIRNVARSARMPVSKLYDDVRQSSGMTEQEYRQEIRRQVLEGKLLNRLVKDRMSFTDGELKAMFDSVRAKERKIRLYHPSWIVLRVGPKPSKELLDSRLKLAKEIIGLVRQGSSFAQLARQYSEDPSTSQRGGSLGFRAPAASPSAKTRKYRRLAASLEVEALKLEPKQVSEPFRFKDAIAVMYLNDRQPSRYTTLDAARGEMMQRVRAEKLDKAKKKWLKDLRRRTHVDVRL